MRKLIFLSLACGIAADTAAAHALHEAAAGNAAAWSFDPWVVLGLAVLFLLYLAGVAKAGRQGAAGRVFGARRVTSFAGAMAVLIVALLSPVDSLSAQLFSAHMVQHLLLMLVAAPLLVVARVGLSAVWALPPHWRRTRLIRWAGVTVRRRCFWLAHPLAIWSIYCGNFVFWHLPGPYRWAIESDFVHAVEHVSFLATAFAFWAVVIGDRGAERLQHGARILFVATAAVLSSLPGALIVVASRPFYAVHGDAALLWGLTPLEDQQLAGLIMWIPGGLIYLATIAALFLAWLRTAELRERAGDRALAQLTSALSLLLVVILSGCDDGEAKMTVPASLGSAESGARHIAAMGCGSCHEIPGIDGARGLVGPPLTKMGRRVYIAGVLRNTPSNMVYWLRNPQRVVPGNAMPDMGIDETHARDIAAYLYTLR